MWSWASGRMWTLWRVGGLETWLGVGVSRLEAAAVYICISDEMPGRGYTPQSPQAAWHTVSLTSIAFRGAKAGGSQKPLGAKA